LFGWQLDELADLLVQLCLETKVWADVVAKYGLLEVRCCFFPRSRRLFLIFFVAGGGGG
jgi:hypothetical protein